MQAVQENESPDKKYAIVIYRIPQFSMMPGFASDAAGFVEVCKIENSKCFGMSYIQMIQLAQDIQWEENLVSIKLFKSWNID